MYRETVSLNCAVSSVCRVVALFVSSLTFCVPELLLVLNLQRSSTKYFALDRKFEILNF